nr:capping protein-inhibiting regulator of actin dynamics-like [Nerophis lumbriciformis]
MEAFWGDAEDGSEDSSGPRKSKIKSLKSRLFGKSKRTGEEFNAKLSQSTSDIHAGETLGSEEDLTGPQGTIGSRALSHDSIFWAEDDLTDEEPAKVSSQENVHSKIKALQMKLQQQKMHLGPPPLVLPVRRQEDVGGRSGDGFPPHKLPVIYAAGDITSHGPLSKNTSQPSSRPLSPIFKPQASKSRPSTPSPTITFSTASCESPLDFSSPALYISCLDTSAARHRMSVKPRNQRASTKRRVVEVDNLNNHAEPVLDLSFKQDVMENHGTNVFCRTSQQFLPNSSKMDPLQTEAAPTSSTLPDQALPGRLSPISSRVLQVKLQRHGVGTSSERPHPSLELKGTSEDSGFQVKTHDKTSTLGKTGWTDIKDVSTSCGSTVAKSSPVCLQDQAEADGIRGIKRPGSGSFHLSNTYAKSRTEVRPRSGSFVGFIGQARHKTGAENVAPSSQEELKDPQPRQRPITVGRLRQEQKSSVLPWERDNLKTVESATVPKTVGPSETAEAKEDVQEEEEKEEGKTVFGFKLRSTSNSMRFWSDGSSRRHSKMSEEKSGALNTQEGGDAIDVCKKGSVGDFTVTGEFTITPFSCPLKTEIDILPSKHQKLKKNQNPPRLPPTWPAEAPTVVSSNPSAESQSAPQTASCEVSWMSLAIEKTRSLHQLFAKRFPKDFTGGQSAACPQTPPQPPKSGEVLNGTQIHSHTVRLQECVDEGGKGEPEQSKTTMKTWKEPEVPQWATQSPLHAAAQSRPSLAQSYPTSSPSLCNYRGLQPVAVLPKSTTTSAQTCASSSPPVDEEKRTVLEKESPSLLGKRTVWAGSVSEKAAFLEKQAEWTTGAKGVELRKPQSETSKASGEPPAQTKPQRQETLSPARVPREEKWMRKNPGSSSSPSSSPVLPSLPDGSQPSWMELAKRKSMAWSDKTMD